MANELMSKRVKKGDIVIDATVGNGNDTIFLSELVGDMGKVYGFDIQATAIINTKKKLLEKGFLERTKLFEDSHENINIYIHEEVDLIVFNLGYLPGGNHEIITKADSTVAAINKGLKLLKKNGIMIITAYYRHLGGLEEKEVVEKFLGNLNQKDFSVLKFQFINQINYPPMLFGIEKR